LVHEIRVLSSRRAVRYGVDFQQTVILPHFGKPAVLRECGMV
jgi:hypothetical protein